MTEHSCVEVYQLWSIASSLSKDVCSLCVRVCITGHGSVCFMQLLAGQDSEVRASSPMFIYILYVLALSKIYIYISDNASRYMQSERERYIYIYIYVYV